MQTTMIFAFRHLFNQSPRLRSSRSIFSSQDVLLRSDTRITDNPQNAGANFVALKASDADLRHVDRCHGNRTTVAETSVV